VRKSILLAVATVAIAFGSTGASAQEMFSRLSSDRLSNVLKAAGATQVEVTKPEAGVEVVTFNDGTGTVNLVLMECTADGCGALQMSVIFEKDARFTLSALNSFNATYLNAQAAVMTSGNIGLMDLYVPAGGVTENNLRANLAVFLESPQLFEKHLQSQVTASADKPGAAAPVAAPKPLALVAAVPLTAGQSKFDVMKYLSTKPGRRLP
jgi:hypothetical protein